ncbi:MAG: amidohydrolase/deacetylase family metallohydrolase [Alphaproteobacteria bacterium]|nr:amidohydrolase/deacetylase family metallohydrolase [Alphaproteobacteria bacterium]
MAICIRNFKPIGLDNIPKTIFIDDQGLICESLPSLDDVISLDCKGAYLSLGWADLHVHVWYGGTDFSIRASNAGVAHGVTAMADAGSAGEANFHGLREYVIDKQPETIKAFINIGTIGLVACNRISELGDKNAIDVGRTLAVIEQNRDVICGIKVRAGNVIVSTHGLDAVLEAKQVAVKSGLPLMVHIGQAPPTLSEIFNILTAGDIITHCFHGKPDNNIVDTQEIFKRTHQIVERGILLDIGHGAASLDFKVARQAIKNGLLPHTVSTDLHERNCNGPVYDLATTISKLHVLGMGFIDCIKAISSNPRQVMGLSNSISFGSKADFTIFDVMPSEEIVTDSMGNQLVLDQVFEPRHAILGAKIYAAARHKKRMI